MHPDLYLCIINSLWHQKSECAHTHSIADQSAKPLCQLYHLQDNNKFPPLVQEPDKKWNFFTSVKRHRSEAAGTKINILAEKAQTYIVTLSVTSPASLHSSWITEGQQRILTSANMTHISDFGLILAENTAKHLRPFPCALAVWDLVSSLENAGPVWQGHLQDAALSTLDQERSASQTCGGVFGITEEAEEGTTWGRWSCYHLRAFLEGGAWTCISADGASPVVAAASWRTCWNRWTDS